LGQLLPPSAPNLFLPWLFHPQKKRISAQVGLLQFDVYNFPVNLMMQSKNRIAQSFCVVKNILKYFKK
jgi:hypothetical protein